MEIIFASNTLSNADQLVNQTTYSRQALLDAIDAEFNKNGLTRVSISEFSSPYVTAYGLVMVDETHGYGVRLEAGPSACGTGIVFDAQAVLNVNNSWDTPVRLSNGAGYLRWSTSEKLIQFGFPRESDPHFYTMVKQTFDFIVGYQNQSLRSRNAAANTAKHLGANSTGLLSGNDFVVQVVPRDDKPEIVLNVRTTDVAKVQAILALLT